MDWLLILPDRCHKIPPLTERVLPPLQGHGLQSLGKASATRACCPTAVELMRVEGVEEVAGGEIVV